MVDETKPHKNQKVFYKGDYVGDVLKVEGNLCWVKYPDNTSNPFIWRFKGTNGYILNKFHEWKY